MEGIQTFKGSWPWPWPWIRPYGIPSCLTHRPLPIYQISFKSKKLFVDGRTYGRTDGHFSPILLGRLPTFGSRPKYRLCWTGLWHGLQTGNLEPTKCNLVYQAIPEKLIKVDKLQTTFKGAKGTKIYSVRRRAIPDVYNSLSEKCRTKNSSLSISTQPNKIL